MNGAYLFAGIVALFVAWLVVPSPHTPQGDASSEQADKFFATCASVGFTRAQCEFFRYGGAK